jgi:hypothetical protein
MPDSVAVAQRIYLATMLGGFQLPNAFAARISAGLSRRYMEATIYCSGDPVGLDLTAALDREVLIYCGAGGAGGSNNRLRFRGQFKKPMRSLWPGVTQLICKGRLYKAAITRNPNLLTIDPISFRPGVIGTDFSNNGQGAIDQDMVRFFLDASGVEYDAGQIGGTGRLFGTQSFRFDQTGLPTGPFTWLARDTALSRIEAIDEVSIHSSGEMAFRTVESLGGIIYRFPTGGRPRGAFDVPQFTQGVDIFRADSDEGGTLDLGNYAIVQGFDDGAGLGPQVSVLASSNDYQGSALIHAYGSGEMSNPMIEFSFENSDAPQPASGYDIVARGRGMSAELASRYVVTQVNRLTKHLSMSTPRDDYVGPGQTHGVLLPKINLTEPLVVQDLAIEVNVQAGSWLQTFEYLGGGGVDPGGSPLQ